MPTWPATVLLVATIALGAVAGAHHLFGQRRRRVAQLHLALALTALAVVAVLALLAPAGSAPGLLPVLLLAAAIGIGWGAGKRWRRAPGQGQLMLVSHVFLGLAGFFTFLAWAARLVQAAP